MKLFEQNLCFEYSEWFGKKILKKQKKSRFLESIQLEQSNLIKDPRMNEFMTADDHANVNIK